MTYPSNAHPYEGMSFSGLNCTTQVPSSRGASDARKIRMAWLEVAQTRAWQNKIAWRPFLMSLKWR
jgi:hypothetical protein